MQSIEQKFQTSKEREQKFWVLEVRKCFQTLHFFFIVWVSANQTCTGAQNMNGFRLWLSVVSQKCDLGDFGDVSIIPFSVPDPQNIEAPT